MKKTIAIIGMGNMGGAIYRRLCDSMPPEQILVCNRTRPVGIHTKSYFSSNINDLASRADCIILAVKPQSLDELIATLTTDLSKKIIISILAGTTLTTLQKKTGAKKIIRAMPNLPTQVGSGVTAWVATSFMSMKEKNFVKEIFNTFGYEIQLRSEAMITNVSVISGCGPAYFFTLIEMMSAAAQRLGFSAREAEKLATTTFLGSAKLFATGSKSAREWREAVTSKKGVTEAVLKYVKEKKVDTIFYQALKAGIQRSKKLSSS
ncbi:pyrroline-5-carboxylate reductase [Candidatus Uhrbacteria bacterium]|nr:pyrroline-5-carboxylate reductase [Candidatus Uhrbacteria bacterium]